MMKADCSDMILIQSKCHPSGKYISTKENTIGQVQGQDHVDCCLQHWWAGSSWIHPSRKVSMQNPTKLSCNAFVTPCADIVLKSGVQFLPAAWKISIIPTGHCLVCCCRFWCLWPLSFLRGRPNGYCNFGLVYAAAVELLRTKAIWT